MQIQHKAPRRASGLCLVVLVLELGLVCGVGDRAYPDDAGFGFAASASASDGTGTARKTRYKYAICHFNWDCQIVLLLLLFFFSTLRFWFS